MMRICVILLVSLMFYGCSQDIKYYHGYVYETIDKPASGLVIRTLRQPSNVSILTDSKGYFKIDNPEWVNNKIYIIEVTLCWILFKTRRIRGGEETVYYFINGKSDTIFLDTKYQ